MNQWRTQEFCLGVGVGGWGGGVGGQQIQFRIEDRENGDMGAIAPYLGVLETAVIWYKKFHFV